MKTNKQDGSVLIFSVVMLGVILATTLALASIILPKIRASSEAVNSISAEYAADSGLEWCLYVNRKKPDPSATPLPPLSTGATVIIYKGDTANAADCYENPPLDYRSVGSYGGVTRSFSIK